MNRRKHEVAKDLVNILHQPQGIRFLRALLQLTGVWGASYAGQDALATAYNEGRRSVGLYLMDLIRAQAPELVDELLGWREERLFEKRESRED